MCHVTSSVEYSKDHDKSTGLQEFSFALKNDQSDKSDDNKMRISDTQIKASEDHGKSISGQTSDASLNNKSHRMSETS